MSKKSTPQMNTQIVCGYYAYLIDTKSKTVGSDSISASFSSHVLNFK